MKKLLPILLVTFAFYACRDANDPKYKLSYDQILTKQPWQLQRYTTPLGRTITDNELTNSTAIVIKTMYFEFDTTKFVTAYDKATNNKVLDGRGAWSFDDTKSNITFYLVGNTLKFRIIQMDKERMVWQSETGSFLTGVGESINLEFVPKL